MKLFIKLEIIKIINKSNGLKINFINWWKNYIKNYLCFEILINLYMKNNLNYFKYQN